MTQYVLSVERIIAASPEAIFDILVDATKHSLIDGSGMVQEAKPGTPRRLELGTRFGMGMKVILPYSTVNRVIELEENRRIAWQTGPESWVGRYVAGRVWRYELEPVEGGTLVRESWDISQDHQRALLRLGSVAKQTAESMTKTLEKIEGIVTAD